MQLVQQVLEILFQQVLRRHLSGTQIKRQFVQEKFRGPNGIMPMWELTLLHLDKTT